jgi:Flp pilus assembly pilin Flp
MTTIKKLTSKFIKDESGASFLEYTVLLGIILVASIVTIQAVGLWAANQWAALNDIVNAAPAT